MKTVFLLLFVIACHFLSSAQLSLSAVDKHSDTNNEKLTGYYNNGNKQFEAFKLHDKLHGQWHSWYVSGQCLDSGLLVKGIPDGTWITYYPDGTPQFIRNYSADKWEQFQMEKDRYHPKRISMAITKFFHDDTRQAEKYTTAVNTFCANQKCVRTGEALKQLLDNNGSGEHYHPVYQQGFLQGRFVNFFPNGAVKDSGNYKDGLPEGLWVKWTENKQYVWKGYYRHGLKNKEWKLCSSNGKLLRIVFYNEGKHLWRKDIKEGIELTGGETNDL